ncbi:MAG: cobalt ECF transporter T component CbiQ [Chloroflexota bacterium]
MAKSSRDAALRRWEGPPIAAADSLVIPMSAGRSQGAWRWSGKHFVEKTIADLATALEQVLFAEETAGRRGLLQQIDPRIKVVSMLVLIISVSLATRIATLVVFHMLALVVAWLSAVPLAFFVKRVWLFIPLFAGIIGLPALFSFVTPGQEILLLLDLGRRVELGPFSLTIRLAVTQEGLITFALLVLRVATSVALAVLLVLTTRWWTLLKALQALHVPQVAILVLAMTYRYIYSILRTIEQTFLARKSRTVGYVSAQDSRRWIGASIATLIAKSYQTSNEVYLAMVSRGFSGEVRLVDTFAVRAVDVAWLLAAVALGGLPLLWERGLMGWVV